MLAEKLVNIRSRSIVGRRTLAFQLDSAKHAPITRVSRTGPQRIRTPVAHPTHLAMAATGRSDLEFSLIRQRDTMAATAAAIGGCWLPCILE
jgi:hypothetical protein